VVALTDGKNDVLKIQKTDTTLEAKAICYSLVSKLQKLHACWWQNGQSSTNAALNGPQGRMASLKSIVAPRHQTLYSVII
jgi:hypothetical protein